MNRLILLDFDGTLFNTDDIKIELAKFWELKYGVNTEEWKVTYEESKNENGAYDYFLHLSRYSEIDETIARADFEEYFKEHNYYFNDALEFIERFSNDELVIFTLGFDNFQSMKINTNEAVKDVGKIAIETNKADFIQENLQTEGDKLKLKFLGDEEYDEIWYVDNRPTYFIENPPKNFRQIRVYREGQKYSDLKTPDSIEEVKLLTDIREN